MDQIHSFLISVNMLNSIKMFPSRSFRSSSLLKFDPCRRGSPGTRFLTSGTANVDDHDANQQKEHETIKQLIANLKNSISPDWPFIDRDESVSRVFENLFQRWSNIEKNPEILNKEMSPLIGIQAVYGGGKSTFIDQVAALQLDPNGNSLLYFQKLSFNLPLVKPNCCGNVTNELYQKYAKEWNDALRIAFTYDVPDAEKYAPDPEKDLPRRVINSYMSKRGTSHHFHQVESEPSQWDDLEATMSTIADHYRAYKQLPNPPRIVMFVDEAAQSDDASKVLSALCSCMDKPSSHWTSLDVIATSSTGTMLLDAAKYSERDLTLISLPMLESIEKLFPPEKDRNATIIAYMMGGVGGHDCVVSGQPVY